MITLQRDVDAVEKQLNLILATGRNVMLNVEVYVTLGTMLVSIFSAVASTFGMNLRNNHEDNHAWFLSVIIISGSACALLGIIALVVLRRRMRAVA
jgi:Mg2+ and Co2+ transporter CorA